MKKFKFKTRNELIFFLQMGDIVEYKAGDEFCMLLFYKKTNSGIAGLILKKDEQIRKQLFIKNFICFYSVFR